MPLGVPVCFSAANVALCAQDAAEDTIAAENGGRSSERDPGGVILGA
jgi:hypothetical protein